MLPNDYKARKAIPLYTYLTQYHPNALVEVAKVAVAGNEQHNPGEPLHWAKGKSMDQLNTAMRHQFDHGMGNVYDVDDPYRGPDGNPILHLAKATWRLLSEIELLCEARDLGIDINTLVRGTHEFRGLVDVPETADPRDYMNSEADIGNAEERDLAAAALAKIDASLVPVGTGPLLPMDIPVPLSIHKGYAGAPTPKGRILACGCFGNCAGHDSTRASPAPTAANSRQGGPRDPAGMPYLVAEPVDAGSARDALTARNRNG